MTWADIADALAAGIVETVTITLGALVVGLVLAVPLTALRRSPSRLLRLPAIAYVEIARAVPPIVWLFLMFYGLGSEGFVLGTEQAAIAGLGLISTAYVAEIYRASLDAIPRGQTEAARALGLGVVAQYRRVLGPQALRFAIPPGATFAIGLLKDSAIASTIGAQEITFRAFQEAQATGDGLRIFVVAAVFYLLLSLPFAVAARATGQRLTRGLAR